MKRILIHNSVFITLLFFIIWSLPAQQILTPEKTAIASFFDITPPLRDMKMHSPEIRQRQWKDKIVKNHFGFLEDVKDVSLSGGDDPVLQTAFGAKASREVNQNFEGISNLNGVIPSDTDGDVSPDHYFQVVNLSFAIYDKQGSLLYGPADNSTIWDGFIGSWTGTNDGDPIVLYDEAANRWMISQFAINTSDGTQWELVAVSQTGDPTGAWYRYAFQFTYLPDYPKFGIWHDGYYLSVNQFEKAGSSYNWKGGAACVLNRSKMLVGDPGAEIVFFNLGPSYGSLLPADFDGELPPAGAPGYFARLSANKLNLWSLTANWINPSSSVLTMLPVINVAAFSNSGILVTQPQTVQTLASISDRLMYRLQYRNFGSYQSLVTNHTVNSGAGIAAVRWYELRKTSGDWVLFQQGTFSPSDGNHRWMGSVAMNAAGDIALGYSVSGNTRFPSICYTGRNQSDEPGLMTWTETTVFEGSQSQTGISRWGDYSCMSVDPANDHDFWFTTEFSNGGWNWRTRIASFSPFVPPVPHIVVSTDTIEFEKVVPGNPSTIPFIIQNIGNEHLTISNVISNNPCFFVEPVSFTVEPGNQVEVYVRFSPNSAGIITGIITIFSDDPNQPEVWVNVSGTGFLTPPSNLQAIVSNYDVSLFWQSPAITVKSLLGYNIYRQEVLLNPVPVTDTTFLESSVPAGNWSYQVAAVYEEGLSDFSSIACVSVGEPHILTIPDSFSELLLSGDSVSRNFYIKNAGDQPLNFDMEVRFTTDQNALKGSGYCIPASNCANGRCLSNFTLSNLVNISSGCSPAGYGDFSGMVADVEAGITYSAGFKGGISKLYVCMWIDFDDDGEFEPEELLVDNLYLKYASTTYFQDITMPVFLSSGQKRLRVRCNYNANANDPCGNFSFGETEDYTVNLTNGKESWLVPTPVSGEVFPGDSMNIILEFDCKRLDRGIYEAKLLINSNDPELPEVEIPVTMNIVKILASFDADTTQILDGDTIDFIDMSRGNISSWQWQFEGGIPSTSNERYPTGIIFPQTGTFDVSLSVNDGTETSYLLKEDYITVLPRELLQADFTCDTTLITEGEAVHFFDQSTGNPDFFKWTIPGGSPEVIFIQNPIIVFTTPGLYDVTLYVSGNNKNDQITRHDYIEVQEAVSTLPPGWEYVISSRQHLIAIPLEANPRIINAPLQPGDYIGLFYTNSFSQKACGGASMWIGNESISVVAQGDDPFTPLKDGFASGEAFEWRIYSYPRGRDFIANVTYNPALLSTGKFYQNGISALLDINTGASFELQIPQGWSGISSPVEPWYPIPDDLFSPIIENLVMIYNNTGVYWPSNNINTMGNWNNLSGYVTKLYQSDTLIIEGYQEKNLTRSLVQGWNFLSVPVLCEKDVIVLFAAYLNIFVLIREIAGTKMYWPQFGINTLGVVKPGQAYHVYANQPFTVQFTACTNSPSNPGFKNEDLAINSSPWAVKEFTGSVHSIAIIEEASRLLLPGDILGAFDEAGNCFGMAAYYGQPMALSVFGDDPSTPEKDGFSEDEAMIFNLYRPDNQLVFELFPVFETSLPQLGDFKTNGLSAIRDFKMSESAEDAEFEGVIKIFPNPGDGKFNISGLKKVEKIAILDLHGREVLFLENNGYGNLVLEIPYRPGVYFARFVFDYKVLIKRIIVK